MREYSNSELVDQLVESMHLLSGYIDGASTEARSKFNDSFQILLAIQSRLPLVVDTDQPPGDPGEPPTQDAPPPPEDPKSDDIHGDAGAKVGSLSEASTGTLPDAAKASASFGGSIGKGKTK